MRKTIADFDIVCRPVGGSPGLMMAASPKHTYYLMRCCTPGWGVVPHGVVRMFRRSCLCQVRGASRAALDASTLRPEKCVVAIVTLRFSSQTYLMAGELIFDVYGVLNQSWH